MKGEKYRKITACAFQEELMWRHLALGYDADTQSRTKRDSKALRVGRPLHLSCSAWSLARSFLTTSLQRNRIESSSVPRWKPTGVFFAPESDDT